MKIVQSWLSFSTLHDKLTFFSTLHDFDLKSQLCTILISKTQLHKILIQFVQSWLFLNEKRAKLTFFQLRTILIWKVNFAQIWSKSCKVDFSNQNIMTKFTIPSHVNNQPLERTQVLGYRCICTDFISLTAVLTVVRCTVCWLVDAYVVVRCIFVAYRYDE
jgi:hypothetical protein